MSDIVEAVARAMAQKAAEDEGLKFPSSPTVYRTYMGLARAAIEAYEKAERDMPDTYKVSIPGDADYTVTWSDYDKPDGPKVNIVREP